MSALIASALETLQAKGLTVTAEGETLTLWSHFPNGTPVKTWQASEFAEAHQLVARVLDYGN